MSGVSRKDEPSFATALASRTFVPISPKEEATTDAAIAQQCQLYATWGIETAARKNSKSHTIDGRSTSHGEVGHVRWEDPQATLLTA